LLTAPILALDAVGPSTPTVLNKSAGDPWYDTLPDSLRESATADALQSIVDLDLDALTTSPLDVRPIAE
jgi:hypothetical protein